MNVLNTRERTVSGEGWSETYTYWWSPPSMETIYQTHREATHPWAHFFCEYSLTFLPISQPSPYHSAPPFAVLVREGPGGRKAGRERWFQALLLIYHISCF